MSEPMKIDDVRAAIEQIDRGDGWPPRHTPHALAAMSRAEFLESLGPMSIGPLFDLSLSVPVVAYSSRWNLQAQIE